MVPITDFTLQPPPDQAPSRRSRLFYRGQAVADLDGRSLEFQFQCGPDYLLLLTEDNPYEETLHVYLLGPDLKLLDRLDLENPYSSGILADVQAVSERRLEFSFFGNDRWRLTVLPSPQYCWPAGLFSPVKRPLRRLFSPSRLTLTRFSGGR